MKKLCIVTLLTCVFVALEIFGGLLANSIAIMSDAAHLTSDVIGIGISILALHMAQQGSSGTYTFGLHRAEIIGALISIFTIWGMAIWLCVEATRRLYEPPEIVGSVMFGVACMSLVFNLI